MRILIVCAAFLCAAAACSPAAEDVRPDATPRGPGEIELGDARRHARELDVDVGERPAGSQQEQAASVYITAHLQQAGYVVFLDAVPVADLVRSTNVVARPPAGGAPDVVVAAAYDTAEDSPAGGASIGLFLEAARALRVAAPDHHVQFVALGAEHAGAEGGRLGSRRLTQALLDDDGDPFVVVLGELRDDAGCVVLGGSAGSQLEEYVPEAGVCASPPGTPFDPGPEDSAEVFDAAGFEVGVISGDLAIVAELLMKFVAARGR